MKSAQDQKILIVDDSEFMRGLIRSIFVKAGHKSLIEADSGKSAVAVWRKERPALVLMDIVMTDAFSGLDALKAIKKLDKDAKVIMVTVIDQPRVTQEANKLGADAFINKPIESRALLGAVKKVLGNGR